MWFRVMDDKGNAWFDGPDCLAAQRIAKNVAAHMKRETRVEKVEHGTPNNPAPTVIETIAFYQS